MVIARTKPKSIADGKRQLTASLARMSAGRGPAALAVPITEIGVAQCRFIVDDKAFPAVCCGASTLVGSSWCEAHKRIVYTPDGLKWLHAGSRARGTSR
jgi:hypothetical protein